MFLKCLNIRQLGITGRQWTATGKQRGGTVDTLRLPRRNLGTGPSRRKLPGYGSLQGQACSGTESLKFNWKQAEAGRSWSAMAGQCWGSEATRPIIQEHLDGQPSRMWVPYFLYESAGDCCQKFLENDLLTMEHIKHLEILDKSRTSKTTLPPMIGQSARKPRQCRACAGHGEPQCYGCPSSSTYAIPRSQQQYREGWQPHCVFLAPKRGGGDYKIF